MKPSKTFQHIVFICIALFITACTVKTKEVTRAFYYWKTDFKLSESDSQLMDKANIRTLYIKLFDIDWNASIKAPLPISKTTFFEKLPSNTVFVPVVFITNKALLETNDSLIVRLAHSIMNLVQNYTTNLKIEPAELQIDCDWTVSTKEKYFTLLREIKTQLTPAQKLSATIRLHQIKYTQSCGIPPIDRGMLMYYNMGKIESKTKNSIFNTNDAEKYASYIGQYPLPLDIALPVFSWIKVFRNNRLVKLLNTTTELDLKDEKSFVKVAENQYKVNKNGLFKGFNLLNNDELIVENCTPEISLLAAQHAKKYFKFDTFTFALYHLNTEAQKQYEPKDFERIYSCFE